MGLNKADEVRARAPAYCGIADDGSTFQCWACARVDHASKFWYVTTPDGKARVLCREGDCIDADWLANATKVPGAV